MPEAKVSGIPLGMTADEAVKQLIAEEGWDVRKTWEGVRDGTRWMIVRGPERETDTVAVGGKLCLVEKVGQKPTTKVTQQNGVKRVVATPPETRKDPTENNGKRYCKTDFLKFHGKKKGSKLWRDAGRSDTPNTPPKPPQAQTQPDPHWKREWRGWNYCWRQFWRNRNDSEPPQHRKKRKRLDRHRTDWGRQRNNETPFGILGGNGEYHDDDEKRRSGDSAGRRHHPSARDTSF